MPKAITVYAIRQRDTDLYLCTRVNGKGGTAEGPLPVDDGERTPRTWSKLGAARTALSAWCKGEWALQYKGDGGPDSTVYMGANAVDGRKRGDMEIVEFRLLEVAKHA